MHSIGKTVLGLALALRRDETKESKDVLYFVNIPEAVLLNTSRVSL